MSEDNAVSSWQIEVENSKNKLRDRLTDAERFKGLRYGEYGWSDLVLGLPDGEMMDRVMTNIKRRAGTETDIISRMEEANIDIFSKLEDKKVGRGVNFRVIDEHPDGKEKWGGWADPEKRETVVISTTGIDRRKYLEWALQGDPNIVWNFVAAFHEDVHTAMMPEVSGQTARNILLARLMAAMSGIVIGAGGAIFEVGYASKERFLSWIGLIGVAFIAGVWDTKPEKEWAKYRNAVSEFSNPIDEVGAYMSMEDVGLSEPYDAGSLMHKLKMGELYSESWKAMEEAVKPRIKTELEELRGELAVLRRDDFSKFRQVAGLAFRTWNDLGNGQDLSLSQWKEATSKIKDGSEVIGEPSVQLGLEKMEKESAVWRYFLLDPKHPDEGGRWGEKYDLETAAVKEAAGGEVEGLMYGVFEVFRAADAVDLSKYRLLSDLYSGIEDKSIDKPKIAKDWFTAMAGLVKKKAGEVGRGEVPLSTLALEGKKKAEVRHYVLRTIILEELERQWKEGEVDVAAKTLCWDHRAMYVGGGEDRFGVEIDTAGVDAGVRLMHFDKDMRMVKDGGKVLGVAELEPIVNEALTSMSEEAWKILEDGLQKGVLPAASGKPDDSDGQLQVMFLTKAVQMIPDRWGLPELREDRRWKEFQRGLSDEMRRIRFKSGRK